MSFQMKNRCREICAEVHAKNYVNYDDGNVFDPEFGYNKDLNTCFYASGTIEGTDSSFIRKEVTDCMTNTKVLEIGMVDFEVQSIFSDVESMDEFDVKKFELLTP